MDWKKIKAEYIAGGTSYRKLAKKYDVPFGTLRRVAKNEGWTQMRTQAEHEANTRIVNAIGEQKGSIDEKYFYLVDRLFDKAEEVIESMPVWQPSSLKEMATAMKYLKECKGFRSEADMREQEARISKLQREAQQESGLTEVTVTFEEEGHGTWAE